MNRALAPTQYVEPSYSPGCFPLAGDNQVASIQVDSREDIGVLRAARDLQADIGRVVGRTPSLIHEFHDTPSRIVIGTMGKGGLVDRLIAERKLSVEHITGNWESFSIDCDEKMLVIAGGDRRGTIFGIYDLCEQIGVSPWSWWADVPVQRQETLFVKRGRYAQGPPAVKYRGIFLNDERPALHGWVHEKFGGYNHKFYIKVFELLLRLKANYLWPAMWDGAFNDDDAQNPSLAHEYGIMMGTSHHEPMLRAHKEWMRYGKGPWDYSKNADVLHKFWEDGIKRNKDFESIVTLAMRGDGDEPMTEQANVALLQRIVSDQRQMIAEHMNEDVTKVPQLWALYKEVQEYYEKGMRVPDDVTLLWCDDNFGNIRRLPAEQERNRPGSAGIYYHFDYVGPPRSYKWINSVPITKIREQMNLALEYGADRIWIVNVGDLKPLEFPIEFFLQMAWDPARWPSDKLEEYTRRWAEREFGATHADAIADIMAKYTKLNGRRKPELLDANTFSQTDYQEADRVLSEWQAISERADQIYSALPAESRAAFFQLVLYPVMASAIVSEMHITAGQHHLYAAQGRASTNELADRVRELFAADQELSDEYNHVLSDGKWNHLMDQTHLGFTFWNQSPRNTMPPLTQTLVGEQPEMGLGIEGMSVSPWRGIPGGISLPTFDVFNQQRRYIDVFNRGRSPFEFEVELTHPWIVVSQSGGKCGPDRRLWVSIDWAGVPSGTAHGFVHVKRIGASREAEDHAHSIKITAFNPPELRPDSVQGHVEANGHISIEAEHFCRKCDTPAARWEKIDDYGRTLSSMTIFPVTAASVMPPSNSPCLEYRLHFFSKGKAEVLAIVAPTLNFVPGRGLRFAVSFDDQPPQAVDALADRSQRAWEQGVEDNARTISSSHTIGEAGAHTLKIWMVDPGVVLQKLVINLGGLRPSYLGPPESFYRPVHG